MSGYSKVDAASGRHSEQCVITRGGLAHRRRKVAIEAMSAAEQGLPKSFSTPTRELHTWAFFALSANFLPASESNWYDQGR